MAHYKSIIDQKQALKKALLQNQSVVNLLMNTGDNVLEFDNIRTGSKSPAKDLIKTHFYVPGTQQIDKNFIAMRSSIRAADNNVVKETDMVVLVICNDDQIDLLQGSRADLLADEIDQILNRTDGQLFGYGFVQIQGAEEVRFADGYSGWQMRYMVHEVNRKAENL